MQVLKSSKGLCAALCLCVVLSGCVDASVRGVTALQMNTTADQTMRVGGLTYKDWVKVDPASCDENEIEFVSSNPEVATVCAGTKTVGALWFEVTAVSGGETQIFAQSKNGDAISGRVSVSVKSRDWIEGLQFHKGGSQISRRAEYSDWLIVEPIEYNADAITFESSDESIATVSKDTTALAGQWFSVHFLTTGTVTITAEADNGVLSDALVLTYG